MRPQTLVFWTGPKIIFNIIFYYLEAKKIFINKIPNLIYILNLKRIFFLTTTSFNEKIL